MKHAEQEEVDRLNAASPDIPIHTCQEYHQDHTWNYYIKPEVSKLQITCKICKKFREKSCD